MAGDKSNSTSCYMHSDTATGKDSLGFKPYVEAIAEFLTAEGTLAPITLSIEGQWGCGKSSFMKQLKEEIEKGNICDISIREFLKYLSLNKEKAGLSELKSLISKLEILFSSIEEKFSQNYGNEPNNQDENFDPYSFENKMKSILIYIPSKIKRRKYFTVWFNCWRYEKEDELWAAFALNFMEQLSEQLSWGWRQWAKIKLVWRRLKFKWKSSSSIIFHILLRVIYIVGIVSFWAAIIYYSPRLIELLFSYSSDDNSVRIISNILVVLTASVGLVHYLFSFGKDFFKLLGNPFDFSKFVQNSNYVEHISFIEHFHSDFYKIVESYAGNSKVYVFVDDLDRCEVPKAAELMQALNLMISDKANVYFSIGIDRKVIASGLAAKNEKVLEHLGIKGLEYGYDYIEKFIQLPFKVPSPKNEDFRVFMKLLNEEKSSLKTSRLSNHSLSKKLKKLFCKSTFLHPSEPLDEGSFQQEYTEDLGIREETPRTTAKEESEKTEKITNDHDCEKSEKLDHILEMVVPALDNNPRRIKQFINQFRFQRTIGKKTGLFCYEKGIDSGNMWNCRKLAKFVAISMKWPSLISAIGSNNELLNQLQIYARDPEKVTLDLKNKDEKLKTWTEDEKLIELLKFGCGKDDLLQNVANYILSDLDFSKLLQISPIVVSPEEVTEVSSITIDGIEFILIPTGDFMMGSPEDEVGRYDEEDLVHKVTIKNPFYLGKYPITQKQWEKVVGNNPSHFKGDNLPVENVSWKEIQEFIKKINEVEGTNKYCLPSEAEWEYACRAGTTTRFCSGDDEQEFGDYAWYRGNSGGETHPVGQKEINPWGLYDMHGNVWEWVQDNWHENYEGAPSDGSAWEDENSIIRVFRGGSWNRLATRCRSASRSRSTQGFRHAGIGFRLLRKL